MHIRQYIIATVTRAQHVAGTHAVNRHDGIAYLGDLLGFQRGIYQLLQALPQQVPADFCNHQCDHHSRHGIKITEAGHGADQTNDHNNRGYRIAAAVPGIGEQHL